MMKLRGWGRSGGGGGRGAVGGEGEDDNKVATHGQGPQG